MNRCANPDPRVSTPGPRQPGGDRPKTNGSIEGEASISVAALNDIPDLADPSTAPSALDCLIVVARHAGLSLKREDLVGDRPAGPHGMTDEDLVARAAACGLRCTPRTLSWSDLVTKPQALPAVVQFADGSSMVLVRIDTLENVPYAIVEDPHANRDALLVLDRLRFEGRWNGRILFVRRVVTTIDESVPFGFELIGKLLMRERRMVLEVAVCTLALSFLALTPMLFMKLVISRVMQHHSVSTLMVLSGLMLFLIAVEMAFAASKRFVTDRLSMRVDVRLSTLVFNKVLRLPIDHFETVPAGYTLHRVNLLRRVRESLLSTMFGSVLDVGVLIVFVPIMMLISVPLTLVILAIFAITVVFVLWSMPIFRRVTGEAEAAEVRKGTFLFQNLAGMRTVKSLALDARQRHKWDDLVVDALKYRLTEGKLTARIEAGVTFLQRLMIASTMVCGAYLAIQSDETISLVTLFTFVLLAQRVAAPLNQAADLIQQYDVAKRAVQHIGLLVNQPEEEGRSGHGLRTPLRGHVEFASLRFKYRGTVTPALKSISFDVPAGMTLGIMGRSGSGKTTITRLLQRLHSDYQGVIRVDGIDVREYDIDHLRSSLGVVLQENFLFSGTIRENITIAKSDASFDEVVQAARLAGAEEFIDKLAHGYDTYIYEGSPNLSGGQRQRIAIARALITDPKLLILDEATSALDAESEAIVNANLRRIAAGRTMMVISHRLASLVSADAIMVLDKGEVHDIGTHQELLERNDIYSGLWYHQNPTSDESVAA